jgi:hypothetical protein
VGAFIFEGDAAPAQATPAEIPPAATGTATSKSRNRLAFIRASLIGQDRLTDA